MADLRKQSGPERPPANFGRRAVEMAESIGRTRQQLAREAGYDNIKTLSRLEAGDGSIQAAIRVRDALQRMGADTTRLPSLGIDTPEPLEDWRREWDEIGRQLHRVANEAKWAYEVSRLREIVRAHDLVAEGTGDSSSGR